MEENIVADEVEFSNETEKWSLYMFWNKNNEAYPKFTGIEIPAKNSFFSHEKGMFFKIQGLAREHMLFFVTETQKSNGPKNLKKYPRIKWISDE